MCQRPIVKVNAFDEQIRDLCAAPKAAELAPQRPVDDRKMKAPDGLTLDDTAAADVVVANAKTSGIDGEASSGEERSQHCGFSDVDDHVHGSSNVARQRGPTCTKTVANHS